jgi:hypothetical protein
MPYFIGYKGKKLGPALSKTDAEEKLATLSRIFNQLEIIKEQSAAVAPEKKRPITVEIPVPFIRPTYENTLYSERR